MHISNPQAVPLSIPGMKPPERPLRWPPLRVELVDTRPPQKRWLREPNLLRLQRLRRLKTTRCTLAFRERRWHPWIPGEPRQCSNLFPRALGRKVPHLSFNKFRYSCRHSRRNSALEIPAPFRIWEFRTCSLAGLAVRMWIRWTPNPIWRRSRGTSRGVFQLPMRPRLMR